jgi:putative DNA primase/helicase
MATADELARERGASFLDELAEKRRGGAVVPLPKAKPALPPCEWPTPRPLVARIKPEPYPIDALPGGLIDAVREIQNATKAPLPLVASSALGALSLACQAHVDVKRGEGLTGPVSLYLLTIADSGERKTTCDNHFSQPLRAYQSEQADAAKPESKEYAANMAAWEARRDGIQTKIKRESSKGNDTETLRGDLARLETLKPEPPRVPRLVLGDETPESLAWSLAHLWPSSGVISSEAGTVLGSHGMGKDSVMRNLSLLNVLWEGGEHSVGRRTSECFTVRGARLTVALQVQEATLREFLARTGTLARGSGFLARFLVAWPETTQGTRMYEEAPASLPALAAFHRRIVEILRRPVPITDDGTLSPALLTFTSEAKTEWIQFHDAIEVELASGGELCDLRDVASKAADNVARMAALFHLFEGGEGGAVSAENVQAAARIVAWHTSEARRFYGELALPQDQADAVRLDGWILEYCRGKHTATIPTREAQRTGPGAVRTPERLKAALAVLEECDRVRIDQDGKRRKEIKVNPALLKGTP